MLLWVAGASASPFAGIPFGLPADSVAPSTVAYAGQKGRLWTLACDGRIRGIRWTVHHGKRVRAQGPRLRDLVETALEADGWTCEPGPDLTVPHGRERFDLCRREGDHQIVVHDEFTVRGHGLTLSSGWERCPVLGDFDIAL